MNIYHQDFGLDYTAAPVIHDDFYYIPLFLE